MPAEPLLGDRAASRDVHRREQREPAEMAVRLLAAFMITKTLLLHA
jgi:hypothetical protein